MISKVNSKLNRKDIKEMVETVLDRGDAYNRFLSMVEVQGGDVSVLKQAKLFCPYNSTNFISSKEGYVGRVNSLLLGELIRRLCEESHDPNIAAVVHVKVGDYIKVGDVIISFYYKNKEDLEKYSQAITGCIGITDKTVKPVKIIRRILR